MSRRLIRGAPRTLYRRTRAWRSSVQERRFDSSLRHDPGAPVLLISPHLDDAVLDCWDLLAGVSSLQVVNLCAGAPPPGRLTRWDEITGASDSAARAHERVQEDRRALARAGREPINLSFLDAQYRSTPPPSLQELDQALCARVRSASRVCAPAGIGGHPDHLLTRRYARTLHRAGMPVTLYAELPYCVRHGWPAWVTGDTPQGHRNVDAYWREFLEAVPELGDLRGAAVKRLDDAAAAVKLAAMECYATQLPALDFAAAGVLSDPSIYRYEVSWELR